MIPRNVIKFYNHDKVYIEEPFFQQIERKRRERLEMKAREFLLLHSEKKQKCSLLNVLKNRFYEKHSAEKHPSRSDVPFLTSKCQKTQTVDPLTKFENLTKSIKKLQGEKREPFALLLFRG